MEAFKYLTYEEIREVLGRIGIRHKSELDAAIAEYEKYWWSTYSAAYEGYNNKDSFIQTMGT